MCHKEGIIIYPLISDIWQWPLHEEIRVMRILESHIIKYSMEMFTNNVSEIKSWLYSALV